VRPRNAAGVEIMENRRRSISPATRSGAAFRKACNCGARMCASRPAAERQFVDEPDVGVVERLVELGLGARRIDEGRMGLA